MGRNLIPWYLNHEDYGDKPWPVQRAALDAGENFKKFGYWMEQGLGKTPLTINEFIHYSNAGKVDFLLIICPDNFKLKWVKAFKEWGAGHIPAAYWPDMQPYAACPSAYVMNWEAIRTEQGLQFLYKLFKKRKVMITFDESSYIGNPSSNVSKKAILIAREPEMVRELNGTRQTKSIMNNYAQLKVLGKLEGLTSYSFRARYVNMGGYGRYKELGPRNEAELAKIIDSCSFTAKKDDWRKDLPPRTFETIPVQMTKKQLRHYKEMKKEFFTIVQSQSITAPMVMVQMEKLKQISSCIAVHEGKHFRIEEPDNNPKFKAMLELFKGQDGKVIVVYTYKATLSMLKEWAYNEKIKYAYIKGNMSPEETEEQKELFNRNPEYRIIFCQERASCTGHDLLGGKGIDRCATMIFVENAPSLWQRLQMLDRNHRGEQDQDCIVYDLVASETENKLIEGLKHQKDIADLVDDLIKSLREESLYEVSETQPVMEL